jgi:hypothetical protein
VPKKIPSIIKGIKKHIPKEIDYTKHSMISYSQFSMYKNCPHRWALTYKDKNRLFSDSIHTIFGTSFHETLQHYLEITYNTSGTEADKIDLGEHLQSRLTENYKKSYETNNKQHFSSSEEMNEFFEDGVAILDFIKKNRRGYFASRGWYLAGIEIPIIVTPHPTYENVLYKGLLDLVLYNELIGEFYIFDIKTSTSGWNDYHKKDELKQFQLILYKQFFATEFNIDVEKINIKYFIVRRKINTTAPFPPKRVQEFIPTSGKNKMNKALTEIQSFIEDCFDVSGKIIDKVYLKTPSKLCNYCPFNETSLCDKLNLPK